MTRNNKFRYAFPPIPIGIEFAGELAVGRDDCFVTGEGGWGLAPTYDGPPAGDAACIRGAVGAFFSLNNLFNS